MSDRAKSVSASAAPSVRARFTSKWVSLLAAFSNSTEDGELYQKGLIVEPGPAGGVDLVVTDGAALLHVHDPAGSASGIVVLDLPACFVNACRERVGPTVWGVNECYPAPLPGWMQPGIVTVEAGSPTGDALVMVGSREPAPQEVAGKDGVGVYVSFSHGVLGWSAPVNWRSVLEASASVCPSELNIQAKYLARLGTAPFNWRFVFSGEEHRLICRPMEPWFDDCSIAAIVMPMKAGSTREYAPTSEAVPA
jgi:hypothetical protein